MWQNRECAEQGGLPSLKGGAARESSVKCGIEFKTGALATGARTPGESTRDIR